MRAAVAFALLALLAAPAGAQSLSPMRNAGATPSDIKGFRLVVGNPYRTRLIFTVRLTDERFTGAAADAAASTTEFPLAPGASRPVIVEFRIGPNMKERTIGVCISPKDLPGPLLPRVCGLYTGRRAGFGG
ncbi:MAG TPA: hypothetical protein VHA07_13895 [Devosia sp.]|nr:hypothetical protein [Devosia sp.]